MTLLDTRTVGEFRRGHIDGFRNIPVDELRERIGELEAGKPVYVICQSGLRSYIATRILMGYGFEAYNFAGWNRPPLAEWINNLKGTAIMRCLFYSQQILSPLLLALSQLEC